MIVYVLQTDGFYQYGRSTAMAIMERQVGHLRQGKFDAVSEIEKEYDALEQRWHFPAKRHYFAIAGEAANTMVMEREWESFAAYETAHTQAFADAEWQALGARVQDLYDSSRTEFYWVVDS